MGEGTVDHAEDARAVARAAAAVAVAVGDVGHPAARNPVTVRCKGTQPFSSTGASGHEPNDRIDGRKFLVRPFSPGQIGPANGINPADSSRSRSPQHRRTVVYEQCALAVERFGSLHAFPESRIFLRRPERMAAENRVHKTSNTCTFVLDAQGFGMSVRYKH